MERDQLVCICCDRAYARADSQDYQRLEHFENYCICQDCLTKERFGWKEPAARSRAQ